MKWDSPEADNTYGMCYNKTDVIDGYYPDSDTEEFMLCDVDNCLSCPSSNFCSKCYPGYTLSDRKDNCYVLKNLVSIFHDTRIYGGKNNFIPTTLLNEIPGFSDVSITCSRFSTIGLVMHLRLITDSKYFESTPFTEPIQTSKGLRKSNTSGSEPFVLLEYKFNKEVNNVSSTEKNRLSFTLVLDVNNCLKFIVYTNGKSYEATQSECGFSKLNVWNIVSMNISSQSKELICTFNIFNLKDQALTTYSVNIPNTEYDSDLLEIMSPTAAFGLNPMRQFQIFEVSNLSIIEYIPTSDDFRNTFSREPLICDDSQCKNCLTTNPTICTACYMSVSENALVTAPSDLLAAAARKKNIRLINSTFKNKN